MTSMQMQLAIWSAFTNAEKPLDKETASSLVKDILKDYPKQLQNFLDWFEDHNQTVLDRING